VTQKITLPLIHALAAASPAEQRRVRAILKSSRKRSQLRGEVMNFVRGKGGIDYAGAVAERYAAEAVGALDVFPPSEAKTAASGPCGFCDEAPTLICVNHSDNTYYRTVTMMKKPD